MQVGIWSQRTAWRGGRREYESGRNRRSPSAEGRGGVPSRHMEHACLVSWTRPETAADGSPSNPVYTDGRKDFKRRHPFHGHLLDVRDAKSKYVPGILSRSNGSYNTARETARPSTSAFDTKVKDLAPSPKHIRRPSRSAMSHYQCPFRSRHYVCWSQRSLKQTHTSTCFLFRDPFKLFLASRQRGQGSRFLFPVWPPTTTPPCSSTTKGGPSSTTSPDLSGSCDMLCTTLSSLRAQRDRGYIRWNLSVIFAGARYARRIGAQPPVEVDHRQPLQHESMTQKTPTAAQLSSFPDNGENGA
ncbi:uncharacterized protein B0H18DRAFT_660882 [Fomitopsis serialis]|uniref:uncharacterized protein n=1 Tax=Fomitopsis serialis TaxID=139415 RepID=UPI002007BCE8|nr:uncharacterized protein B0H18DRAFT_660882 [Neoantrodia serialis]KAH9918858.1 hypothetical protein B0H18DRAFT_660882 [Neoantrodia serialis]